MSGENRPRGFESEWAAQRVWAETIRKEQRLQQLKTDFTLNPHTMYHIAEKPGQTRWSQKYKTEAFQIATKKKKETKPQEKGEEDEESKAEDADDPGSESTYTMNDGKEDPVQTQLKKTVRMADTLPNQKYEWPQTTAQEIGWDSEPLATDNESATRQFYAGRRLGEVTRYADAYHRTTGQSVFAGKK